MIKVSIVGIGLIGGSISICLKKQWEDEVLIKAYDENAAQLHLAESLGVIDYSASSLDELVQDADVIFLCTPVQALSHLIPAVMHSPLLKSGAIVTDVGSTKVQIVEVGEQCSEYSKGVFIGGHPMAGSHKSGVESANERLFQNAYYVLTPSRYATSDQIEFLSRLLDATKANVVQMSPEEHDQIVGAISHFPHLIASSLVEHVNLYNEQNAWYFRLAAGGFRDITRIASSNPRMWRDITVSNREILLELMKDWLQLMQEVYDLVAAGNPEDIEYFFSHAKDVREQLPVREKGAIPSFYDLYVDVPDHPGVIGEITTMLGKHDISIINIRILETREDILGVLRLSFRFREEMERAEKLILEANYPVYRRE